MYDYLHDGNHPIGGDHPAHDHSLLGHGKFMAHHEPYPNDVDGVCLAVSGTGHDLVVADTMDYHLPEGNVDMIMSYPDPLLHAHEYQPEPFFPAGDDVSALDSSAGVQHIDYVGYQYSADGGIMPQVNSTNELAGVNNGMLEDASQLDTIIKMGEVQGTAHIDADQEHRSASAVTNFLHQNGYTEIPAGYEVHHIVPLSQGGADSPENMILLTEAEHQQITNAHKHFYGW